MIKFSIIIPIYNVENYLKKCLDSVKNQTFKNYEVIMVCDKSQDNSEEIANNYQSKKFKKVYKEKTGLSIARNIGVTSSVGEYILFLDGDDYFEEDLLQTLNDNLTDTPDIIRFQARDITENNMFERKEKGFGITSGIEAFKNIINYHYIENAWCYCYNANYFKNNKFEFMPNCIAEDYGLTPLIIAKAKKVKSLEYIGYNYVQRSNSLMRNVDYGKKIKKIDDMLVQADFLKKELKKIQNTELFITFINNSLIYYVTTLRYKDFKKYNRILKEKRCYDHLLNKGFKRTIINFIIERNAFIFYNYIMRLKWQK